MNPTSFNQVSVLLPSAYSQLYEITRHKMNYRTISLPY
jgi:hypothetical protein